MRNYAFPTLCLAMPLLLAAGIHLPAVDEPKNDDFVPMFNGTDLTGWVNVNCAPSTFYVKDKEIITTGRPTGFLRTAKQYENFIAEFDWMHVNKSKVGNSGFFVWADPIPAVGTGYTRGIEVQVLVNLEKPDHYTSHGDLFSIWGARCTPDRPHPQGWERCLPSERRCKGGGEWNHYKVTANDGAIKLEVNGKEVSGISKATPRKGYLALESEGAECHFRNLMIKELPSTNPIAKDIANVDPNFKNLYTGLDLSGWTVSDDGKKQWLAQDSVLVFNGEGNATDSALKSGIQTANHEVLFDFRFPKQEGLPLVVGIRENQTNGVQLQITRNGNFSINETATPSLRDSLERIDNLKPAGEWNRIQVSMRDKLLQVILNGKPLVKREMKGIPEMGVFVLRPKDKMEFTNLFVRPLK